MITNSNFWGLMQCTHPNLWDLMQCTPDDPHDWTNKDWKIYEKFLQKEFGFSWLKRKKWVRLAKNFYRKDKK